MSRLSLISIYLVVLTALPVTAGDWEQLSTATIGADRFIEAHPEWDGRGVLVAICDSGVELGLPGLQQTSNGEPKVLDAREFSSEGRFDLEPAERESDATGTAYHGKKGRWLYGIEGLEPAVPEDGQVLIGYLEEESFRHSGIPDLNNNGRSDDIYGLVTYQPAEDEPWVAFLDSDADGDLGAEQPIHDFAVAREAFTFGGNDLREAADMVTCGINLWPQEQQAALVYDGNGHGTHVSGITAGFGLNGQEGYNGIAPGAQLLAYKIGNDSLSGGATTSGSMLNAWRHAVRKAEELGMPLVIQMSYGIGSEDETRADAERLIDKLMDAHPGVVATVSAGNAGPGLSTIGLPAASPRVLTIGAAIARTTAELEYGVSWTDDRMFAFSARGGELAKPDVVAPGFAASSVPDWGDGRDVYHGTSMASPQVAGACALLLSAANASDLPIRRDLVYAALTRTARALPGYGPLDQGPGMVDLPRAWEAYQYLAARSPHDPIRYTISSASPELSTGTGPTVFYRGELYPTGENKHEVVIEPVFAEGTPDTFIRRFYRAFALECEADWVKLDRPSVYLKQRASAELRLSFAADKLREPGLYQTTVRAYDRSLSRSERRSLGPDLMIPVAVAVPHRPDRLGSISHIATVEAAHVERIFMRVTPWTGQLSVEVELPPSQRDRGVKVSLFDPEGREHFLGVLSDERPQLSRTFGSRRLQPGVWELSVWGDRRKQGPVRAECRVQLVPLASTPTTATLAHQAGSAPAGSLSLCSVLDATWRGHAHGVVVGTVTDIREQVSGDTFERTFSLAPEEAGIDLELEVPVATWSMITDLAVQILDSSGAAVAETGFEYRRRSVSLSAPDDAGTYTLRVMAGIADPDLGNPVWDLQLRELRRYRQPVAVSLTQGDGDELTLYPDHGADLDLQLAATPPQPPPGYRWWAELTMTPLDERQPELQLELALENGPVGD